MPQGAVEGGEEGEGGGGSDLQAVLKTVLPIIGSLSGIVSTSRSSPTTYAYTAHRSAAQRLAPDA